MQCNTINSTGTVVNIYNKYLLALGPTSISEYNCNYSV